MTKCFATRYVSHIGRCAIKSFTSLLTEISFGQLPRLVRYEPVSRLRRGTPLVIKIFKKLCTLKHFMAVAACLLQAGYVSEQHPLHRRLFSVQLPRPSSAPSPSRFFSPAAKAASPTDRRATPPRFITRRV